MLFIPEFPWSDLHTLNLDWLLSVVASHERQLRDIEGSASPYDEAPLADGIADPGNVNKFARGDHRHPTDTTRASVVALQAVQDSVPGPSNGNPRMDGDANPGFYVNYSRADHVHPRDTSKQDTIKRFVETVGDITLSSAGFKSMTMPSAVVGKQLINIMIRDLNTHTNGGVTPVSNTDGNGNAQAAYYIIGEPNTTVTGMKMEYWYV